MSSARIPSLSRALATTATLVLGAVTLPTAPAAAEELVLMNEPTTYTDVVDAFDDHDVFDLHIHVGYLRQWELGRLQREVNGPAAMDDRAQTLLRDVGNYELQRNGLMFGLDVGVFRDLAIYARLPLILSDDRTISPRSGLDPSVIAAGGMPLFQLPPNGFRSPTRSGVDWMSVGLAWSILNQHRQQWAPTWVLMVEGRFNIGEPMRACGIDAGGGTVCRPDVDSMGNFAPGPYSAGVGRGVNALRIETRASFREGMLEPYGGLMAQIEWPGSAGSLFLPSGDLRGYINRLPPVQGRFTAGLAIIPWEDRQHFQRFTFDLRFQGDYVSEGRDYSPLFDALGSSTNPYLSNLTYEGVPTMENPTTDGLGRVQFNGLTDTQSHGRFGGQVTLEMQAAQYVRFQVGTTFMYSMPYNLTQSDACNPNVRAAEVTDPRLVGDCRASSNPSNQSIINPHHRPAIDMPGNRFRMDGLWNIDLYANVSAMF
ncbi:MAG: hypothetical protein OHK0013_08790 [Sandaracinaceae bacterium]